MVFQAFCLSSATFQVSITWFYQALWSYVNGGPFYYTNIFFVHLLHFYNLLKILKENKSQLSLENKITIYKAIIKPGPTG
jgi:hypothetical protein